MTKRILAMVLCLMLILAGAVAETADAGWRVTIDQITVGDGTKTVALNPSVELALGKMGAGYWMQLALVNGGETTAAVQAELDGEADTILASADGANDCLIIDGVDTFLEQYELNGEIVRGVLDEIIKSLNGGLPGELAQEIPGVSVEKLDDHSYAVAVEMEDVQVSLRVSWSEQAEKPFDLSGKNPCRYTYREMYPGDGTNIPDALTAALNSLMTDESVLAAAALFGPLDLEM